MVLTTFFRGNYTILISSYNTGPIAPANFDLYVLITGWDKAYAYNLTAPQAGATYVSLNSTNFLSYEDTYEINFKNEITDENWTYTNLNNQTLFVKCADYSQVILDLKYLNNITGKSWIYLATREAPSLQVMATDTSGNTHQREQKMDAGNNVLDFYLIPIPFNKNVYSFGLLDYTGQYASAEFQAKTHISYNYPQIFSRDFDDARYVQNFECIPNHDYNIIVCSNSVSGLCTSLGKITCLNNETKTLIINTPSLGNADYNFNDLTTAWTSTNTNVGVTYSGQSGVVKNVIFNVFNTTGNYTLIYTNNLVTSSGTFTYALPNLNGTYYVEAIYNTSTHGLLHSGKSWSLGNLTWSNAFNMTNLGASYMGLSRVALLSMASMILVVTILLIAGKATSMGIGIISASLSWGALYGFGWIPHAIPFWIFFIFLFIGVAVKWSEGRAEVIS
jgi:hypothetical protein